MNPEFDVQLSAKDLYRFNLRQVYTSMQGPISILIGGLFIASGVVAATNDDINKCVLYIAFAIIFLAYNPVVLWLRAKKTMKKNTVLSGILHYTFTEDAIVVKSGDETGELPWDGVFKMVRTGKYVRIYSNRINAYIIPVGQMGESYTEVKALAEKKLERYRVKMK